MGYKRLTEKTIVCFQYDLKDFKHKIGEFNDYDAFFTYSMAVKRLGELEDKIENGTLVELPCKVGDVMYEVIEGMPIQEWKIESICFNRAYPKGVIWAERTRDFAHWKFWIEDCGTKWFATKAEAEKRLEEIKNETKSIDNSEK
jgi:hypothetical protein